MIEYHTNFPMKTPAINLTISNLVCFCWQISLHFQKCRAASVTLGVWDIDRAGFSRPRRCQWHRTRLGQPAHGLDWHGRSYSPHSRITPQSVSYTSYMSLCPCLYCSCSHTVLHSISVLHLKLKTNFSTSPKLLKRTANNKLSNCWLTKLDEGKM